MNMSAKDSMKLSLELAEDQSTRLGLRIGSRDLSPGDLVPRADAQSAPQISFQFADPTKTYLVVSLDPDAPYPSSNSLSPILHWIHPGFKVSSTAQLRSADPAVADYIGAAPPPDSEPHRYLFLLYEQPLDFDGAQYTPPDGKTFERQDRIRYDLDAWEKRAKLNLPVAANYFMSN